VYRDALQKIELYRKAFSLLDLDPASVAIRGSVAVYEVTGLIHRRLKDIDLIAADDGIESQLTAASVKVHSADGLRFEFRRVGRRTLKQDGETLGTSSKFHVKVIVEDTTDLLEILPVDLVTVENQLGQQFLQQQAVKTQRIGLGLPILTSEMLIIDKAKLLATNAHAFGIERQVDLADLATIGSDAKEPPDRSRMLAALQWCSILWKWNDWVGFPDIPASWAAAWHRMPSEVIDRWPNPESAMSGATLTMNAVTRGLSDLAKSPQVVGGA
jgi:hypothetical protein